MIDERGFRVLWKCGIALLDLPLDEGLLRERVRSAWLVLDGRQRADLLRGLRVLDARFLGLWTTGRWERFTRASPGRRERRLHALARSRVPRLRTLYVALHRFCAGLHYGDPRWHREGFYPGPPALDAGRGEAS